MTTPLRVAWIISGNEQVASCRLQGFLVHEQLGRLGVDSQIVATDFNATYSGYSWSFFRLAQQLRRTGAFDVLMFERPNWMAFKLSQLCRMAGVRTIGIRCDLLPGPYDEHFDLTIVPTEDLATALGISRFRAIEDMVEVPEDTFKRDYAQHSDRLVLAWVGHPGYRDFIVGFAKELGGLEPLRDRIEIRTISRGPWATHQWALETVHDHLIAADIAILPIPEGERFAIKSANRLTMCMALGLPTIATPIRSYESVGRQRVNWLAATTPAEFCAQTLALGHEETRRRIGIAARVEARERFSPARVAEQWLAAVTDAISASKARPTLTALASRVMNAGLTLASFVNR